MAKLADIMTSGVYTLTPTSSVAEAAQAMVRGRFGSIAILEGAWLVGIFTERDVMRAAASGGDLSVSPVSQWMTADPVTGTPDMESEDAADLMLTQGFRHLPVLDGRELAGIVSLRDLLSSRIRKSSR